MGIVAVGSYCPQVLSFMHASTGDRKICNSDELEGMIDRYGLNRKKKEPIEVIGWTTTTTTTPKSVIDKMTTNNGWPSP